MIIHPSPQVAAEYVGVTAYDAARSLSTLARDARDFAGDNPLLIVALVALAIFFFVMTRPGTH